MFKPFREVLIIDNSAIQLNAEWTDVTVHSVYLCRSPYLLVDGDTTTTHHSGKESLRDLILEYLQSFDQTVVNTSLCIAGGDPIHASAISIWRAA